MSVIIKDIERNSNEIVRIEISEFKGKELINLRIWYKSFDNNGNMIYKPTQKGIAINIGMFDELKDGIQKIENYLKDKKDGFEPES